MLLRAFSSGAVALSGVEAVSNGVPAFRKPESRNASMTIAIMGVILGTCFLGVSILASHFQPYRGENDPTGIALMAQYVYGGKGVLFWITQIATFAVLILAANTAYADFPRLSSIIARDGYLPRQLANRGDRLVFSNGVIGFGAARRRADRHLQGQHLGPHPAVRVRRVHRVHAQPGGHGRPPLPITRAALAAVCGGQRRGLCRHGHRRPRRRRVEVHRGRVHPGDPDPGPRRRLPGDQPPLQAGAGVGAGRHELPRPAPHPPRHRARRLGPPGRARRAVRTPGRWRPNG